MRNLWYNISGVVFKKERMLVIMLNEDKFNFDIENIKRDLAIENLFVTDADVALLRKYYNNEITMDDVIASIKNEI